MGYTVTIINSSGVHRAQLDNSGATDVSDKLNNIINNFTDDNGLDGDRDIGVWPDFHQIFFYGDYRRQVLNYCNLFGIEPAAL